MSVKDISVIDMKDKDEESFSVTFSPNGAPWPFALFDERNPIGNLVFERQNLDGVDLLLIYPELGFVKKPAIGLVLPRFVGRKWSIPSRKLEVVAVADGAYFSIREDSDDKFSLWGDISVADLPSNLDNVTVMFMLHRRRVRVSQ